MIIKDAKRIFNSDKICCSYCDFYFGVTFLEYCIFCLKIHPIFKDDFAIYLLLLLLLLFADNPCKPLSPMITSIVFLHVCLSSLRQTASVMMQLHQSTISSLLLLGLLQHRELSIIPNMTAFTRRVSHILQTCLNNCSFLFMMVSTIVSYHLYTETLAHSTLQLSY